MLLPAKASQSERSAGLSFPASAVNVGSLRSNVRLSVDAVTVPLELPGRGDRRHEQPYRSWQEATTDLADRVAEAVADGGEYALLGHSLGAALAYEIAHRLRAAPPAALSVVY